MNILLLSRWYYPMIGGVENTTYEVSRELAALGHEARILTGARAPQTPRREYARVEYLDIPSNRYACTLAWANLRVERRFRAALRGMRAAYRPDMIFTCDASLVTVASKVYPGVPVIYHPPKDDSVYRETVRAKKRKGLRALVGVLPLELAMWLGVRAQREAIRRSALSVVFCEGMRRQLAATYGPVGHVTVRRPGCSLPCERGPALDRPLRPARRLLFLGRLLPTKNTLMLMDALALLKDIDWHLTVVGDGSERAAVEARAERYGLNARFVGAQTDVRPYYLEADLMALPSRYESFGQVIVEAFSSGVPVAGFATIEGQTSTAVEELVEDGKTGFVCRTFTAEAFADTLRRAMALPPQALANMRAACLSDAERKYSWRAFVAGMLSDVGLS